MNGRVALITGAAGGIGQSVARRFADRGYRLVLADRGTDTEGRGSDPAPLEALAASLQSASVEVVAVHADLSLVAEAERLVDEAHARMGRLDALVSLAGFRRERSLIKLGDDDLESILRVHLTVPLALVRSAARRWVELRAPGAVVVATSATAFFGAARQSAAAAASAGLAASVRSAAAELRRHQIRVNSVAPTARTRLTEDTPLFRRASDDTMTPDDVAPLITWLVSDDATELSGEILGVAGGRVYALQSRETTGAFSEGTSFDERELNLRWNEILRGS